jgi:hypothetical protein
MPFRFSRISVLFVPLATPTTSFDMMWFVYLLKRASLPDIFLRCFSALQLDARAAERGVKRILYIGDFDPSGLLIEKVAEKEMSIEVVRIALTFEQIKRFKPPSLSVNMRDSRAKDYVAIYGDRCWELEALRPRTLFRLIEVKLRENVPAEFLVEAEARERAAKVARPVTERMRRVVEKEVRRLLEAGVSEEQILSDPASKYGLHLRKTGKKRGTAT